MNINEQTEIEQAAEKAIHSGSSEDLAEYLKERRDSK